MFSRLPLPCLRSPLAHAELFISRSRWEDRDDRGGSGARCVSWCRWPSCRLQEPGVGEALFDLLRPSSPGRRSSPLLSSSHLLSLNLHIKYAVERRGKHMVMFQKKKKERNFKVTLQNPVCSPVSSLSTSPQMGRSRSRPTLGGRLGAARTGPCGTFHFGLTGYILRLCPAGNLHPRPRSRLTEKNPHPTGPHSF